MSFHDNDESEQKEVSKWGRYQGCLITTAALYPFKYSKVLMQLGYEPIPAVPCRWIFCKSKMVLPNYFQYAGHIRKIDGFFGWYRGLTPELMSSFCSMFFSEKIANRLGLQAIEDKKVEDLFKDEELYLQFKNKLKRDVVLNVSGIIIAQPLHVVSVRMMAQFIGRESLYKTILGSFAEIYGTEGIFGFFAGIVPKILFEVACLVLASSTAFLLNKYVITDTVGRRCTSVLTELTFRYVLYPYDVVSTCMTVTGSRLRAGNPPFMPVYKNWISCFNDLHSKKELERGGHLFHRFAGDFVRPVTQACELHIYDLKVPLIKRS